MCPSWQGFDERVLQIVLFPVLGFKWSEKNTA